MSLVNLEVLVDALRAGETALAAAEVTLLDLPRKRPSLVNICPPKPKRSCTWCDPDEGWKGPVKLKDDKVSDCYLELSQRAGQLVTQLNLQVWSLESKHTRSQQIQLLSFCLVAPIIKAH